MFLLVTGDTFPLCIGPSDELKAPEDSAPFLDIISSFSLVITAGPNGAHQFLAGSAEATLGSDRSPHVVASVQVSVADERLHLPDPKLSESDVRDQAIRKADGDDSGPTLPRFGGGMTQIFPAPVSAAVKVRETDEFVFF